jgi:hypothetical protein
LVWATSLALLVGVVCGALLMKAAGPREPGPSAIAPPHQEAAVSSPAEDPRLRVLEARVAALEEMLREKERVESKGTLEVFCVPACDRIEIDGVVVGATPLPPQQLAPGEHVVVLESKGAKARRTVVIQQGRTATLRVVMQQPDKQKARPVTNIIEPNF